MSELYRRLSLADRKERAKRARDRDREAREAQANRSDLLARFAARLDRAAKENDR